MRRVGDVAVAKNDRVARLTKRAIASIYNIRDRPKINQSIMLDSLIQSLKKVKDCRRTQGRRHPLWFILLIIILGIMQGYVSYRAFGDFAKYNQRQLVQSFHILPRRVPSYSTIRRVMMNVDWQEIAQIFNEWSGHFCHSNQDLIWVGIDGKSLKSTVKNYEQSCQNFVAVVSLYAPDSGLVLRLDRHENKKASEIHQVLALIEDCPFQNQVFTLDALHCQKDTTRAIVSSGNDYLIAIKKNQKKLYEAMVSIAESEKPSDVYQEIETGHGRMVSRQVSVFNNLGNLPSDWYGVESLIRVERKGKRGKKDYYQMSYYISSREETAARFAQKIRGHWQIENQLHWVKDVIFKEDESAIADYQAITNLSILQTIALNLFRLLGFVSITEGLRWLGNKWSSLLILLE